MPSSHTEVYVHFVWTTKNRQPIITTDYEEPLYKFIRSRCQKMQAHITAIGGMPDHVHLLIRMPPSLSISQVAQDIKGSSSHFVAHALGQRDFRWQGAYGAFSVGKNALESVTYYIENQKIHHGAHTIHRDWEPADVIDNPS